MWNLEKNKTNKQTKKNYAYNIDNRLFGNQKEGNRRMGEILKGIKRYKPQIIK